MFSFKKQNKKKKMSLLKDKEEDLRRRYGVLSTAIGVPLANLLMCGCEGLAGALINFIAKAEETNDPMASLATVSRMIKNLIRKRMTATDFTEVARSKFGCVYPEDYVARFNAHVDYFHAFYAESWKNQLKTMKYADFYTRRLKIPISRKELKRL